MRTRSDTRRRRSRPSDPNVRGNERIILAVLGMAQFNLVFAFQTSAIALPSIGRGLDLGPNTLQWVVSANALALGGLLLVAARAGDLFGHHRLFMVGLALFGGASLACGLAPGGAILIAARAAQGAATAMFVPATLALLTDLVPAGRDRNRALGMLGIAGALGGITGIALGGALAAAFGWRSVFLLNAPLPLIPLVAGLVVLPPGNRAMDGRRLGLVSAVTITGGLGALVFGLSRLSASGGAVGQVLAAFTVALALLGAFVLVERQAAWPLIPAGFLGRPAVWVPNLVSAFQGAATNTPIVFYTLFMQDIRGYSALVTGIAFLPCNAALIAGSTLGGRLVVSLGRWRTIGAGMAALVVGLPLMAGISVGGGYGTALLPGLVLLGLGLGVAQVGIVSAATAPASDTERGLAAGLVTTTAQIGTAIGLAVLVAIAGARTAALDGGSGGPSPAALVDGYRWAFVATAGIAAIGLAAALAMLRRDPATGLDRTAPSPDPARQSPGH